MPWASNSSQGGLGWPIDGGSEGIVSGIEIRLGHNPTILAGCITGKVHFFNCKANIYKKKRHVTIICHTKGP